jgi:hypothetical protein
MLHESNLNHIQPESKPPNMKLVDASGHPHPAEAGVQGELGLRRQSGN